MKSSELSELLDRWTSLVTPPTMSRLGLQALRGILDHSASGTVASAITKLKKVESVPAVSYEQSWGPALDYIDALICFVSLYGKPAVAKDAKAFFEFLTGVRDADVSRFSEAATRAAIGSRANATAAPIRIDVVQKYNRILERALGDEQGFNDAVREIDNLSNLSTPELLLLAKQFALASTKSRPTALKKIKARHEALMSSRAKSSATGGRVAG